MPGPFLVIQAKTKLAIAVITSLIRLTASLGRYTVVTPDWRPILQLKKSERVVYEKSSLCPLYLQLMIRLQYRRNANWRKRAFLLQFTKLVDFNNLMHEIQKCCVLLPWSGQKFFMYIFEDWRKTRWWKFHGMQLGNKKMSPPNLLKLLLHRTLKGLSHERQIKFS